MAPLKPPMGSCTLNHLCTYTACVMLNLILKQVQEKRQLTNNLSILTQKMVLLSSEKYGLE
jgi:hypothetical protein